MPPSPEEQAAIKRWERNLDAQPWARAEVEKLLSARRAKRAQASPPSPAPPKAPALNSQN